MYQYKFKTDIVVPVRNALPYVRRCIDALYKQTQDFKLIIVNDNSDQETSNYLDSVQVDHPSTLIVKTGKQQWFTRASNIGLRMVRTPKAVLLNSDAEVHEGWLEELYWVWDDMKSQGLNPGLVASVTSHEESRRWCETHEPDYLTGHCVMWDMQIAEQVAAVRNTPGWYLNQTDISQAHINSDRIFCYELNRLGYNTAVSYKSWVDHEAGKSWGHDLNHLYNAVTNLQDLD